MDGLGPDQGIKTLLVLGASGDLTGRLLLPGLGRLLATGAAPDLQLVGAGSDSWDEERWHGRVREAFEGPPSIEVAEGELDSVPDDGPGLSTLRRLEKESVYVQADVTSPEELRRVLAACQGPVAIYFALPPAVTLLACEALLQIGVPEGTRLVLEKPFGSDRQTARDLNDLLTRLVPEPQVHRVDHFLGKYTVLNVLGFRFANRLFEPVWNATHVERVDIVFDEQLSLENRARYYDSAGALRDMIQSHLLQILAIIAMDPPATMSERDVRDRRAEVLRATRLGEDVRRSTRRARYTAGEVDGRQIPSYVEEPGVEPARSTETLAEITCYVDTWRWKGVPFRLRSGKALGAARKEAVITLRQVPHLPDGLRGPVEPTRIRIGFGPDCLRVETNVNGPGHPMNIERAVLSADFGEGYLPAYGEVLAGVLQGDPLLSVRGDVAEECWRIVEPALAAWDADEVPMEEYPAGSGGPGCTGDFPDC